MQAAAPNPTNGTRRSRSGAQDIDRHVGQRIRERRLALGLTQQELANLIGVTYQQAHKYERGVNRISAGRLHKVAQILNVPIAYFFEGLEGAGPSGTTAHQRLLLDLARSFTALPSRKHQEALCSIARLLAEDSGVHHLNEDLPE
jgi:transcriptional regulator with XRE-family HTH domain